MLLMWACEIVEYNSFPFVIHRLKDMRMNEKSRNNINNFIFDIYKLNQKFSELEKKKNRNYQPISNFLKFLEIVSFLILKLMILYLVFKFEQNPF